MKNAKQSVGDTATSSKKMSGVVEKVQDTLTVLEVSVLYLVCVNGCDPQYASSPPAQEQVAAHKEKLSSELAEIHNQLGNMTLVSVVTNRNWVDVKDLMLTC